MSTKMIREVPNDAALLLVRYACHFLVFFLNGVCVDVQRQSLRHMIDGVDVTKVNFLFRDMLAVAMQV